MNALFFYLKSRVSACLGTGKRILTADLRILDNTAIITDLGRVGSLDSVFGYVPNLEVDKFLKGFLNQKFDESWEGLGFNGVLIDIDENGHPFSVESIREYIDYKSSLKDMGIV
ncbi:hypothetical protein BafHLJ01_0519 [Borreliella afzelii HLJ01]|nr:hypothetical protein BafHLJ01_0519 [Borreliella afzelii HLJ01]